MTAGHSIRCVSVRGNGLKPQITISIVSNLQVELISSLVSDLEKGGRLGRMQYKKFHSEENLQGILNDAARDRPKPNDLSNTFSVESDEWTLWMERQLNIRRVLSRAAYRAFRRFRVWW